MATAILVTENSGDLPLDGDPQLLQPIMQQLEKVFANNDTQIPESIDPFIQDGTVDFQAMKDSWRAFLESTGTVFVDNPTLVNYEIGQHIRQSFRSIVRTVNERSNISMLYHNVDKLNALRRGPLYFQAYQDLVTPYLGLDIDDKIELANKEFAKKAMINAVIVRTNANLIYDLMMQQLELAKDNAQKNAIRARGKKDGAMAFIHARAAADMERWYLEELKRLEQARADMLKAWIDNHISVRKEYESDLSATRERIGILREEIKTLEDELGQINLNIERLEKNREQIVEQKEALQSVLHEAVEEAQAVEEAIANLVEEFESQAEKMTQDVKDSMIDFDSITRNKVDIDTLSFNDKELLRYFNVLERLNNKEEVTRQDLKSIETYLNSFEYEVNKIKNKSNKTQEDLDAIAQYEALTEYRGKLRELLEFANQDNVSEAQIKSKLKEAYDLQRDVFFEQVYPNMDENIQAYQAEFLNKKQALEATHSSINDKIMGFEIEIKALEEKTKEIDKVVPVNLVESRKHKRELALKRRELTNFRVREKLIAEEIELIEAKSQAMTEKHELEMQINELRQQKQQIIELGGDQGLLIELEAQIKAKEPLRNQAIDKLNALHRDSIELKAKMDQVDIEQERVLRQRADLDKRDGLSAHERDMKFLCDEIAVAKERSDVTATKRKYFSDFMRQLQNMSETMMTFKDVHELRKRLDQYDNCVEQFMDNYGALALVQYAQEYEDYLSDPTKPIGELQMLDPEKFKAYQDIVKAETVEPYRQDIKAFLDKVTEYDRYQSDINQMKAFVGDLHHQGHDDMDLFQFLSDISLNLERKFKIDIVEDESNQIVLDKYGVPVVEIDNQEGALEFIKKKIMKYDKSFDDQKAQALAEKMLQHQIDSMRHEKMVSLEGGDYNMSIAKKKINYHQQKMQNEQTRMSEIESRYGNDIDGLNQDEEYNKLKDKVSHRQDKISALELSDELEYRPKSFSQQYYGGYLAPENYQQTLKDIYDPNDPEKREKLQAHKDEVNKEKSTWEKQNDKMYVTASLHFLDKYDHRAIKLQERQRVANAKVNAIKDSISILEEQLQKIDTSLGEHKNRKEQLEQLISLKNKQLQNELKREKLLERQIEALDSRFDLIQRVIENEELLIKKENEYEEVKARNPEINIDEDGIYDRYKRSIEATEKNIMQLKAKANEDLRKGIEIKESILDLNAEKEDIDAQLQVLGSDFIELQQEIDKLGPKVDVKTPDIVDVEALLRDKKPIMNMAYPNVDNQDSHFFAPSAPPEELEPSAPPEALIDFEDDHGPSAPIQEIEINQDLLEASQNRVNQLNRLEEHYLEDDASKNREKIQLIQEIRSYEQDKQRVMNEAFKIDDIAVQLRDISKDIQKLNDEIQVAENEANTTDPHVLFGIATTQKMKLNDLKKKYDNLERQARRIKPMEQLQKDYNKLDDIIKRKETSLRKLQSSEPKPTTQRNVVNMPKTSEASEEYAGMQQRFKENRELLEEQMKKGPHHEKKREGPKNH